MTGELTKIYFKFGFAIQFYFYYPIYYYNGLFNPVNHRKR